MGNTYLNIFSFLQHECWNQQKYEQLWGAEGLESPADGAELLSQVLYMRHCRTSQGFFLRIINTKIYNNNNNNTLLAHTLFSALLLFFACWWKALAPQKRLDDCWGRPHVNTPISISYWPLGWFAVEHLQPACHSSQCADLYWKTKGKESNADRGKLGNLNCAAAENLFGKKHKSFVFAYLKSLGFMDLWIQKNKPTRFCFCHNLNLKKTCSFFLWRCPPGGWCYRQLLQGLHSDQSTAEKSLLHKRKASCATGSVASPCCALCWPLLLLALSTPTNVYWRTGSALYGMASARSLVIGSWAHCFACWPFFRPFVVSFFLSLFSEPVSLPV